MLVALEPRVVPSQAPFTPPAIAHAYGFDQIKLPGGYAANGQGQTIAIIEIGDTPMSAITTALNAFDAGDAADGLAYTLPPVPNLAKVDLSGGQSTGTEGETLLDVEWAHALAPAANLIIFEAAAGSTYAQQLNYFMAAVSNATHYNGPLGQVSVVSMSYGFHEDQLSANLLAGADPLFTTPANHIGITFVASAGDDGAGFQQRYPYDVLGSNGNEPPEYPSISPNVIAVGGTTLTFPAGATSFAYPGVATTPGGVGESVWGNGSLSFSRNDFPGSGSGGGVSLFEGEPAFQTSYGLHYSNGSFNARTAPDVSLDADPNTGVLIYDSYDPNQFGQPTGWTSIGGTSFSAPAWAALFAIADEARAAASKSSLDGPTQTLPDLYQLSSNDYHDITHGSDGLSAGPGYDLATGLGTPIASRVVGDLWGQPHPAAKNDAYTVALNTTLTVPATSGLLTNDTDPMGEALSVSSYTQPANGSLTVYQDGSFTYQPSASFSGTDSFTYMILDTGSGVGSTATVQITVNQGLADLAPYTPSGWSGPLVVSTQSGGTTTAGTITTADTVYIDWAFINQGSAAITSPFQTELLLDGTVVHTWTAGVPLNPTFYTYATGYALGQLAAGSHTVTIVADSQNQVIESNKNNNTTSYTFTVTQPALSDLAPYTPTNWSGPIVVSTQAGNTVSASTITVGDTVYLDWAFINQGGATINNAFGVELLLDGTPVHTWPGSVPLDANHYTYITDYSLGQLAAGTHTVSVVADYQNTVPESNETNNTSTYTFTVMQPALPDLAPYTPLGWSGPLVVTTLSGSNTTATSITTTNTVYIDWAFINRGDAAIDSAYQIELLLDGTAVQTWSGPVPLSPNFYTYINNFSLGQLAAGSHTVTVVADNLNQLSESDKTNNTTTYAFTVTQSALPDLSPYTPLGWSAPVVVSTQSGSRTTSSTITTSDSVYIDWSFINQGSVAINNPFGVELLLDGTEINTWAPGVPLFANYYTYITDYSLGQLTAGTHTVTAVADYLNQVAESNKANNRLSYTFTVTQPALPDLAPHTPSGWSGPLVVSTQAGQTTSASTITTADSVYIDWAFINQGNATIDTTFHTELLLDGVQVHTWFTDPPLAPTIYTFVQDFSLGQLAAGTHTVTVVADYLDELTESQKNNNEVTYTFTVTRAPSASTSADFDGDGKTDIAAFGPYGPGGAGRLAVLESGGATLVRTFGGPLDQPVAGDFDGDGKTDIGVYGPYGPSGTGRLAVLESGGGVLYQVFGGPKDRFISGDFDGDGKTDSAVYGPYGPNGTSRLAVLESGGGVINITFGGRLDTCVPGDFDGDGKTDIAVYGPYGPNGLGRLAVLESGGGAFVKVFGGPLDQPVAGDFDGDGKADVAVYGPYGPGGAGRLAVLESNGGAFVKVFGGPLDRIVSGDFDGDGKTDIAVYGPYGPNGVGRLAILFSGGGAEATPFGGPKDIPLPPPITRPVGVSSASATSQARVALASVMSAIAPARAELANPAWGASYRATDWLAWTLAPLPVRTGAQWVALPDLPSQRRQIASLADLAVEALTAENGG